MDQNKKRPTSQTILMFGTMVISYVFLKLVVSKFMEEAIQHLIQVELELEHQKSTG